MTHPPDGFPSLPSMESIRLGDFPTACGNCSDLFFLKQKGKGPPTQRRPIVPPFMAVTGVHYEDKVPDHQSWIYPITTALSKCSCPSQSHQRQSGLMTNSHSKAPKASRYILLSCEHQWGEAPCLCSADQGLFISACKE